MSRSAALPQVPFTYPSAVESPVVLCVDDDPEILELLEDVLTACGLRPICTTDCQLALRLSASEPIDVAVLDYHMPEMDGVTLAEAMRASKPDLPMILFSGAPLPLEALATVSHVVHKREGAMRLADTVLAFVRER